MSYLTPVHVTVWLPNHQNRQQAMTIADWRVIFEWRQCCNEEETSVISEQHIVNVSVFQIKCPNISGLLVWLSVETQWDSWWTIQLCQSPSMRCYCAEQ